MHACILGGKSSCKSLKWAWNERGGESELELLAPITSIKNEQQSSRIEDNDLGHKALVHHVDH